MNKVIRWVTLGALFIIPLIPILPFVAQANSFFFPFITGKNFAFRILVEIAFAGWILLTLSHVKYRPRFSWTGALLVAFTVWMALADALAVNPEKAFWSNFERMDGWVTLIHLFMLFVVMGSMFTVDNLWKKWWYTFLSVAGIICAYGFLQVTHLLAIHQGGVRLDATFGNSDYLACYLLFAIAIAAWLAFEAKQKWLQYLLVVLAVIEVIILFLTATRGAILGFVGAAVLAALLWMVESGTKGRKAAGAALLTFLVLIGGFFLMRHQPWIQHDPTLGRIASISLSDPETHARITIWHMALEGFVQKPITGWGQEGFNYIFNKYYEPSLYGQEPWFDRAHNMYLDWLTAGGAPALLLYLGILLSAVIALYRRTVSRPERILLIAAFAAYTFQGFFVFDNLFSYVPFVALLAIAHAASSRPIQKIEKAGVVGTNTLSTIALPIVAVVLLLVLWFVNVPGMSAASDIITALTPSHSLTTNVNAFKKAYADNSFATQEITEQLVSFTENEISSPDVAMADKQALFSYAIEKVQGLVAQTPNDARIRLEFALLLRAGSDYGDALKQAQAAEQLSPAKQSIIIEEGIDQLEVKNLPAAKAAFTKAYQLDKSFPDLASYAAAGYIFGGDLAMGKSILLQALGTTTATQEILLVAYYQTKDYTDLISATQLKVIQSNNSAASEYAYAEALANGGLLAAARAEVQKAIAEHPTTAAQGSHILQQMSTMK